MDPLPADEARGGSGIPRTRGDGPDLLRGLALHPRDSPHPRGWTLDGGAISASEWGFPAPAGMDPPARRSSPGCRRIPRTRGDGPAGPVRRRRCRRDSPHPRGWTSVWPPAGRARIGFPAPAGMDPDMDAAGVPRHGIPRTRGDGPDAAHAVSQTQVDSPHPRGWTRGDVRVLVGGDGFPAPAGMDPARRTSAPSRSGIPRTRGDGPIRAVMSDVLDKDSPHPRGWTCATLSAVASRDGFPAPAGMDRDRSRARARSSRIPRTRGDGPGRRLRSWWRPGDSPHPRGWTLGVD